MDDYESKLRDFLFLFRSLIVSRFDALLFWRVIKPASSIVSHHHNLLFTAGKKIRYVARSSSAKFWRYRIGDISKPDPRVIFPWKTQTVIWMTKPWIKCDWILILCKNVSDQCLLKWLKAAKISKFFFSEVHTNFQKDRVAHTHCFLQRIFAFLLLFIRERIGPTTRVCTLLKEHKTFSISKYTEPIIQQWLKQTAYGFEHQP